MSGGHPRELQGDDLVLRSAKFNEDLVGVLCKRRRRTKRRRRLIELHGVGDEPARSTRLVDELRDVVVGEDLWIGRDFERCLVDRPRTTQGLKMLPPVLDRVGGKRIFEVLTCLRGVLYEQLRRRKRGSSISSVRPR